MSVSSLYFIQSHPDNLHYYCDHYDHEHFLHPTKIASRKHVNLSTTQSTMD